LIYEIRKARNALPEKLKFEVVNYGAVGASVADLLYIYETARTAHPDLVVIELTPHLFFSGEPLLRTDLKGMIFHSEYGRLLSLPPIREAYSRNDWAEAWVYSFFAPYRFIPLLRDRFKAWVYSSGLRVMDFFPWRLNRAEEWRTAMPPKALRESYAQATEYPGSELLLRSLMQRLAEDRVPALFVIQERDKPLYPVEQKLKEWTVHSSGARTLDLSSFFKIEEMPDHIHFNAVGARESAQRILPSLLEMVRRDL
jgi:hypothetical protein